MWPRAKPRPPCTTARYTTSLMPILHQSGPRYHTGMATQTVPLQESKILRAFSEKTPRSRALQQRALSLLPNGVTHIVRYLEPHSDYIEPAQIGRGAHYGASHALEVEWAELVHQMIPSAEQVCFTASGTEATHLALRL